MNRRLSRKSFLSTGAIAAAAFTGTSRAFAQNLPGQFRTQVTIAVSVPLSGAMMAQGLQVAGGVRAAIAEANQYSGPLDRYFALRTFDDMGALATAITNVQFALSDPTVVAAVGDLQSSVTTGAISAYANAQMPLIVPTATADSITAQGYRNVWRLPTKDSTEGALFAAYVAKNVKPKSATAVTQDGDYGFSVAQGFSGQMKNAGVPCEAYVFPYEKPDFAAAAKALLLKSSAYLYLCGKTADMGPLVPALRAAGFTGTLGASEGFYNPQTTATYGDAFGKNALFSTSMPPLNLAPSVFQLLQDFRARYGRTITPLGAFGYAAAQIVIALVQRSSATDHLTVFNAMQRLGAFQTIVGDLTFSPTGDPIDPNIYIYGIDGKQFKFVKPAHPTAFVL